MTSRWALAAANQLASGLVMFVVRELKECRSRGLPPASSGSAAKPAGLMVAMVALGSWGFGSLGSMLWWLATGRGPGGRFVAAGSVTPRPYKFSRRCGSTT